MHLFRRVRKAIKEVVKKSGGLREAIVPYDENKETEMIAAGMSATWIRYDSVWIRTGDSGKIKMIRLGSFNPLNMWRSTAGKRNG